MRTASRVVLLAAAALLAAACSMTKLAYMNVGLVYDNADTLLGLYADDYLDLNAAQKAFVREKLVRAMAWHRSQELPEVQRFLEDAAAKAGEPFTLEDVSRGWQDLRAFYVRAADQLLPDIAELMSQLEPAQVVHLERRFAKATRRAQEEAASRDGAADRRADRLLVHLEEFTGPLTSAQRDLVHRRVAGFPETAPERIAEWRKRQAQTLALVRARPDPEKMLAGLRGIAVEAERTRDPEYARKLKERDRLSQAMIVELSAMLSPEQRAHLQRRLRGYARDFRTLSAAS